MGNSKNLIPNSKRTPSELREMTRKGGKASVIARRKKKVLRELIDVVFNMDVSDGEIREQLLLMGIPDNECTNQMALVVSMFRKALNGDVQAFNTLRDTAGQKPKEQTEVIQKLDVDNRPLTQEEAKTILEQLNNEL